LVRECDPVSDPAVRSVFVYSQGRARAAVSRLPEMNYSKAGSRVPIMSTLQRMVTFIKGQLSSDDDKQLFLGFFLAVAFGLAIVIVRQWLN
jgi:hypothetical protein